MFKANFKYGTIDNKNIKHLPGYSLVGVFAKLAFFLIIHYFY